MVLNPEGVVSYKALHNDGEVYPPQFSLANKWAYMTAGIVDTAITSPEDASIMITTGPFDIPAAQTVRAAFAILGGNNLAALQSTADAAIQKYDLLTSVDDQVDDMLPVLFGISGNYPNPFNPSTVIKYSVDKKEQVRLEIFDLLGRKLRTLVNEIMLPGNYEIGWNGKDFSGSDVSSGVYFVRLVGEVRADSKKIILVR